MPTSATPKRKPSRGPEFALTVQYGIRSTQLPPPTQFRKWMRAALTKGALVTLRVVGARQARLLNRRYRKRDYATNVLTFVYSHTRPLTGDIAICAPVVVREARMLGINREAHYAHLTVHGMLHLQGHDHQRSRDAERMERLEARILARLGYSNPYGEQTRGTKRKTKRPDPLPLSSRSPR